MVLQDSVGVSGIPKVHRDMPQRGSNSRVDVRISHEGQDIFSGAEDQRVETKVQRDGLGADQLAGIQKPSSVVFGWSRWAEAPLRGTSEPHGFGMGEGELVDQVSHLGREGQESGGHV